MTRCATSRDNNGIRVRRCAMCKKRKPLHYFYAHPRRGYPSKVDWSPCRPCLSEKTARIQAEKKAWIDTYKLEHGCVDCGYAAHPAALDFDHLPGTEKHRDIRHGSSFGWKALFAEVEKCEVVCANCHRIRTVNRYAETSQEVMPNAAQLHSMDGQQS